MREGGREGGQEGQGGRGDFICILMYCIPIFVFYLVWQEQTINFPTAAQLKIRFNPALLCKVTSDMLLASQGSVVKAVQLCTSKKLPVFGCP